MDFFNKIFQKKTKAQIIAEKSEQILNDLFLSGFNNNDVSIIIDTISKEGKSILQNRKQLLEQELIETNNAINRL